MALSSKRILIFGASGTIGRACVREFAARGYQVVCFVRPRADTEFADAEMRRGDVTDPRSIAEDAFRGESFDVVLSCLASRSGAPDDAWLVDHQANSNILGSAISTAAKHMILLSAICVQKPRLEFQSAKLTFEKELIDSGLTYSIVRPTAFFKSLSGQIKRVREGKPFLLFGDGKLTSCKPISDDDLAAFTAGCVEDKAKHNAILPIGGHGPAITPLDQGHMLFELTGKTPRFRRVPVKLLDVVVSTLAAIGRFSKWAKAKAEYARIGRYYATESMLVLDPATNKYDAKQTPQTGSETLRQYYAEQLQSFAETQISSQK